MIDNNTGTVLKNRQINNFIQQLSGIIAKYPEEFLTVNIHSPELNIAVVDYDFFNIGHVEGKLKITIENDLPEHIKLKIFHLFDDIILGEG